MCEMEMPTPCQHCGNLFDLLDGYGSNKWYPNTQICADCSVKEDNEMIIDEEIENLKIQISDAEIDIKEWKKQLKELETKTPCEKK